MYKVFVNDKPIILSDKIDTNSVYDVYLYKNTSVEEIVHKLQYTQCNGIYYYHHDLDVLWQRFKSKFQIVNAAGGLVLNTNEQALFIRRNDHWDLPKGKMEVLENAEDTAIREVQEECSINHLEIITEIGITYHVYQEQMINHLKKTFWFLMNTSDKNIPTPQKEEGITEAKYIAIKDVEEYYDEMYSNIKEIVQCYLKIIK